MEALTKFYPVRYQKGISQEEKEQLEENLTGKWRGLAGKSVVDCVRILLTCTRKWQFFGASLFQVKVSKAGTFPFSIHIFLQGKLDKDLWLAVNEDGVSLLDYNTMQVTEKFYYPSIITFGGCQEDFMMVIVTSEESHRGNEEKLLFETSKPKILEITLLIADYMNMMGQHLPLSQKATNLSRGSSRAVSKSRLNVSNTGTIKSAPNTPRLHSKEETSILRHGSNAGSMENTYHKGQKLSQESPIA